MTVIRKALVRKLGDQGRDLPRDPKDYMMVQDAAQAAAREAAPGVDGISVVVFDDRERALAEFRRDLVSGAAVASQRVLTGASEMMRMTGNGTWNSPNGFDRVAFDTLRQAEEALLEALVAVQDLRAEAMAYVERGGWDDPMRALQRGEAQRQGRS